MSKANPAREAALALAAEISKLDEAGRAAMAANMPAVVTIEGRPLSHVNTVLAVSGMATATVVGGFRQWQAAGRCVRKGERALWIFAPVFREKEDGTTSRRFVMVPVFDVSQTDAAEVHS